MPYPTLTFLKYFVDACEHKSIAKSAQINFVSAPAVSNGIRRLESELNMILLDHKKNKFQLTQAGDSLYKKASELLTPFKNITADLKQIEETPKGDVQVGISQSLVHLIAPDFIAKFLLKNSKITPSFKLGRTKLIQKLLLNGLTEIGIAIDDGSLVKFKKTTLLSGNFLSISKTGASSSGYIISEFRPEIEKLNKWHLKKYKRNLPVKLKIESWETIFLLGQSGLGTAFIPDFLFKKMKNRDKKSFKVETHHDIPYEIIACYKSKDLLSKQALLFLTELKRYFDFY